MATIWWICCVEPQHICGPTKWSNSNITLNAIRVESEAEQVIIADERNGVRIIAESFEMKENVKL